MDTIHTGEIAGAVDEFVVDGHRAWFEQYRNTELLADFRAIEIGGGGKWWIWGTGIFCHVERTAAGSG